VEIQAHLACSTGGLARSDGLGRSPRRRDSLNRPAQRNGQNFGYTDLSDNAVISPAGTGETTLLRDPTGAALATKTGSDPARLIRDDPVHGDVVATVDPTTGNPTATATYNPWGTPTSSTGTLPLGYQGAFTDPDTGLVAAQARWYNPESGSFASRDTLALPADPTPQTNRYLYGNASPLYLLDPTGHWPDWLKKAWGKVTEYTDWWWSSFQAGLKGQESPVAAPTWVSTVNNWVDSHKADIVEGVVGTIVFAGCEAVLGVPTAGVGAVAGAAGCGAFAGGVAGFAGQAERCREHQTEDACTHQAFNDAAGSGLLTGLIGGGLGAGVSGLFGRGLSGQAGSALRKLMVGIVGGGTAGAAGGGASGGVLAAIGYAGNCQDTCSWHGLLSAAGQGAEHGAELGVIFGVLGSAFGVGRACTHSFAPDTRVLLADGNSKPIKDVAVNDRVIATDPNTGATTPEPVTDLHLNRDTDLTDVTVAATVGTATATLHTTQHHPFWDNTSGTWVEAKDIVPGHELRGPDGSDVRVVTVHNFAGSELMRDLTVANVHTYYVVAGTTPVLVHNCPGAQEAPGSGAPRTLFHYTSEDGYKGITQSNELNASIGGHNAEFGPGQYLTDVAPERVLPGPKSSISPTQLAQGFMSRWQLSHLLTTTPWKAPQFSHYLEIDVSGLEVQSPRPGTFRIPGETPLDLTGRIVRGGRF
jgi:large repetitive protein